MENKRRALGRGLEQLFSNESLNIDTFERNIVDSTSKEDILEIEISELRNNPYQPRTIFDEEKLNELAKSIKEFGVIQPIIVKKSIKGYEIIAGERRTRASKIAGKQTIPAIVKDFTDEEMMQIALLENIQREDLSSIEEANAYKKLIESLNITQNELAEKLGKSRSYITNLLGLLRLPQNVQDMVNLSKISMAHARILSKLENEDKINFLANKIMENNMSVRDLESITSDKEYKRTNEIKKERFNKYEFFERKLKEKLGTKVKITDNSIVISYKTKEDLERLLKQINIDMDVE